MEFLMHVNKYFKVFMNCESQITHPQNMDSWGRIKVKPFETGDEYWSLIEELRESGSGFFHNRAALLDAMLEGQLYGLEVEESLAMFKCKQRDPVFMNNPRFPTFWMLPCFCVKVRDTAQLVWVHPRARRLGFGTRLVCQLGVEYAWDIMDGSQEFWKSLDIPNTNKIK
jgi:hypothetical protein